MTRRATFTQAELARAMRAARGEGLVPVLTPLGLAFVESHQIALPSPDISPAEVAECDKAFGVSR